MSTLLAQSSSLGDGRIDNWIIDSSVHVTVGVLVLVTMTAAAGWVVRLAVGGAVLDATGRWVIGAAQITLAVQILLGIKLLDQGQGIGQLYIHYVGGLIPMGAFLAGGWLVRGDTDRSTRILAVLLAIGWLSAVMAFGIGQAYVNR
ncbi:MAG: hypothetical protein AAGA99_05885 [Actinomycetota bacterium]